MLNITNPYINPELINEVTFSSSSFEIILDKDYLSDLKKSFYYSNSLVNFLNTDQSVSQSKQEIKNEVVWTEAILKDSSAEEGFFDSYISLPPVSTYIVKAKIKTVADSVPTNYSYKID